MIIRNYAICFALLSALLLNSSNSFAQSKGSTAVKVSEPQNTVEVETPSWTHGSLMFDKQTSEWINTAIKSHDQKIPIEILLPNLFPTPAQEAAAAAAVEKKDEPVVEQINKVMAPPKEVPEFYLKSILYFSRDNWSLWLNDKKISDNNELNNDATPENVSVSNISAKQAIFLWKKSDIDHFYPNWKDNLINIDDTKYTSAEKNIVVDSSTGNISFILKPNQSFVPKTMEIVEGNSKASLLKPVAVPNAAPILTGINRLPQAVPNETKTLDKNNINPMNVIQNMETINSVLKQNVEKAR